METILEVSIRGHKAGVLAWDRNRALGIFEFSPEFPALAFLKKHTC